MKKRAHRNRCSKNWIHAHIQEQCIQKRGFKHFHPPSYLSQRNTCCWFSTLTTFLSLSDGSDDGCYSLESLHPLPPPPCIHRWPLPLPLPLPLSLSIVNSTPFTSRLWSLSAPPSTTLPPLSQQPPGCAQDGGDLEIILSYIWLQMWGYNLQIPAL